MKKILLSLVLCPFISTCFAIGPNELSLNGTKFIKSNERSENNKLIAEYLPKDRNLSSSIIITQVMDKNEPGKIIAGLKGKKSVEVFETESLKPDRSDMLVSFVKFDLPHLKVQNNLCRIIKNPHHSGSLVFQYIETNRLKNQAEGTAVPDFTLVADNLKQLPLEQYLTSMSHTMPASWRQEQVDSSIPWYKRPNARAGKEHYLRQAPMPRNTTFRGN